MDANRQKQEFLRMNLTQQMNNNAEMSEASRRVERAQDQKFIKHSNEAQQLEHEALKKKDQVMK